MSGAKKNKEFVWHLEFILSLYLERFLHQTRHIANEAPHIAHLGKEKTLEIEVPFRKRENYLWEAKVLNN
jgi:hypothetical protein